jgi:hypothetical protein
MTPDPADCRTELTVLVPTYRRTASLHRLLDSIDAAHPPEYTARVIIVDNGLDVEEQIAAGRRHPTRVIRCRQRGKNHALNAGLRHVREGVVTFLDDDVTVDPSFFRELSAGLDRWPDAAGVGGRVEVAWPIGVERPHPRVFEYVRGFAYAAHDFLEEEGVYPAGVGPSENNVTYRHLWLLDWFFDEGTGPGAGLYRMGSGEALYRRVCAGGGRVVHVPHLRVHHHIRPEQSSVDWLLRRAHSYGRSMGHHRFTHGSVSGMAPTRVLLGAWAVRLCRQVIFSLRSKDYPRLWAQIDRKLIEGILWERLLRMRPTSRRPSAIQMQGTPRHAGKPETPAQ